MLFETLEARKFLAATLSANPTSPPSPLTDPAQDLPWNIRQISSNGARAAFSPGGRRLAYMDKEFGNAWEINLKTGAKHELTGGFKHAGFLRVQYLQNGDYLLTGPAKFVDSKRSRWNDAELWVMKANDHSKVYRLGQKLYEGVAVSRQSNTIAWAAGGRQYSSLHSENLYTGDIVYSSKGVPRLAHKTLVYKANFGIEAQDFRNDDREIICPKYKGGAAVIGIDRDTHDLTTYRDRSGVEYNEPEGIFPDGKSILLESSRDKVGHENKQDYIDLWRLTLVPGSNDMERLTRFGDVPGFKASNPVVSPDGRYIAFQSARAGDTPGHGHGIFLLDLKAPDLTQDRTTIWSDHFASAARWRMSEYGAADVRPTDGDLAVQTSGDKTASVSLTRTVSTKGFNRIALDLSAEQSRALFEADNKLTIDVDSGDGFVRVLTDAGRFNGVDNATAENGSRGAKGNTDTVSTGYLALLRSAANGQIRIRITASMNRPDEQYLLDHITVTGRPLKD